MNIADIGPGVFEKKFKAEKSVKVRERLQILWYIRTGYTQREVAAMLSLSNGIVAFWKKRFEDEGYAGLEDKVGRGRKTALTDERFSMLGSELSAGILLDDGYRRGYLTKDVAEFLREAFNLHYTTRHCRNLLQQIGCSLQVPRPHNKSRNQEAVAEFQREFKKNERGWVLT